MLKHKGLLLVLATENLLHTRSLALRLYNTVQAQSRTTRFHSMCYTTVGLYWTRTINQHNTIMNYSCPFEQLLRYTRYSTTWPYPPFIMKHCVLLTYTLHSGARRSESRGRGESVNVVTAVNGALLLYLDFNLVDDKIIHSVSSYVSLAYFHWHLVQPH